MCPKYPLKIFTYLDCCYLVSITFLKKGLKNTYYGFTFLKPLIFLCGSIDLFNDNLCHSNNNNSLTRNMIPYKHTHNLPVIYYLYNLISEKLHDMRLRFFLYMSLWSKFNDVIYRIIYTPFIHDLL